MTLKLLLLFIFFTTEAMELNVSVPINHCDCISNAVLLLIQISANGKRAISPATLSNKVNS